jgi:hypothetical protein
VLEPIDHRINSEAVTQSEFLDVQIRFLPTTIEFVRNRFVYKTVEYAEVDEVELKRGFLIKNRWIVRMITVLVTIAIIRFVMYGMIQTRNFSDTNSAFWFNRGSILFVWGPALLIIGMLLVFIQSFIRSTVLVIVAKGVKHRISIRKLDKKGEIGNLMSFLRSKGITVFDNTP